MTSKALYVNDQIGARDDGLCPTKLPDDYTGTLSKVSDEFIEACQTNSHLMNTAKNTSAELEFLCKAISRHIIENVDENDHKTVLISLDFEAEGCVWKMDLNPDLAVPGLQIQVRLLAKSDEALGTIWVAQTYMVDTKSTYTGPLSKSQLKKLGIARIVVEQTSLVIRKAVLRCEFPEFPEGCKGTLFKEVYKLNAKVRERNTPRRISFLLSILICLFQLKKGANSSVCRGTHRVSGRVVAVKCVRRADLPSEDDAAVYDEVTVLSSLGRDPPRVVPLVDFFEEEDAYYLVKEMLTGDPVLDRIAGMGYRYNERIARGIVSNILEALSYCHEQNIAHRDVNSKNLIFIDEDKDRGIKLAGFGFAARCHAPESMTRQCGTPLFVAPEVLLKKPYGMESDMWSAGCVAFLLLSGDVPFAGETQKDLFRAIVAGKYAITDYWTEVSDEGKQFVSDLLQVDPTKRLSAKDALNHAWMSLPDRELNPRILEDACLRIRDFQRNMLLPEDTNSN